MDYSSYILFFLLLLWFINRYVFSWLGLFLNLIGLIHYKAIDNIQQSVQGTKLSYIIDLNNLASAVGKNPKYQILSHGHSLLIIRKWGKVEYHLFFTNSDDFRSANSLHKPDYKGYFKCSNQQNRSIDHGEKPSVPSHTLKRRVFCIVNDLPLSNSQKREIKKSIRVGWYSNTSLGWI